MTDASGITPVMVAADALAGASIGPRGGDSPKKLKEAGVQFETLLINSLLEKFDNWSAVPGETQQDAAADTVHSIARQALASELAKSGKFGIGNFVLQHVRVEAEPK